MAGFEWPNGMTPRERDVAEQRRQSDRRRAAEAAQQDANYRRWMSTATYDEIEEAEREDRQLRLQLDGYDARQRAWAVTYARGRRGR